MNVSKVAIIQDYCGYGGRFMVLSSIIELLNQEGITPDLVTFRSDVDPEGVTSKYQQTLAFDNKMIRPHLFGKLTEFNKLWFNLIFSLFYARKYDLIINSNNTPLFLPAKKVVHYIHFPRYVRVLKKEFFTTHLKSRLITRIVVGLDYFFSNIIYALFRARHDQTYLANSAFTKSELARVHKIPLQQIETIYPPAIREESTLQPKKELFVVSIGRFSQSKNQLSQLRVAKQLPELNFKLIGFSPAGNTYLHQCKDFIEKNELSNVELLVNIDFDQLHSTLERAAFFFHTTENEPFGITPVQAIDADCIPVVHDSGGPRESVPLGELRYADEEQAVSILRRLLTEDHTKSRDLLKSNLKKFTNTQFMRSFALILNEHS